MTFLSGRTQRHGEHEITRWVGIMETSLMLTCVKSKGYEKQRVRHYVHA